MANKTKPAAAKKHTNPKGRVAFFCYVKPQTLKLIKGHVDPKIKTLHSQGHVVDVLALFAGRIAGLKRPIA